MFKSVQTTTVTKQCIDQLENAIFRGELDIGDRLPTERQLGQQMGVSKTAINGALSYLIRAHLIRKEPRHGYFVADYVRDGDLNTLNEIVKYKHSNFSKPLFRSLLTLHQQFGQGMVELIMQNRAQIDWQPIDQALAFLRNAATPQAGAEKLFVLIHEFSIATGNKIYPLALNSLKNIYVTCMKWMIETVPLDEVVRKEEALVRQLKSSNHPAEVVDYYLNIFSSGYQQLNQLLNDQD